MSLPSPTYADLVYARIDERALTLDLYLPENGSRPFPLIVWIHGGAFRLGDKRWCQELLPLLDEGYAIASIDYRLSQEAIFPAQIRDIKAAVRWLRAHAPDYGVDPKRFAAGGSSAGGHLAAMLGASIYYKAWDRMSEYTECPSEEISSAVQAVVDWYGPTDFLHMNDEPGEQDHFAPDSPESELIGDTVPEHPDLVAAASPMHYLAFGHPPFLIIHGTHDRTVLPNQSILLHEAIQKRMGRSELLLIEGARHGFEGQQYQEALEKTRAFLSQKLSKMGLSKYISYACTKDTFRPRTRHAVRWLNPYTDYELARAYWNLKPNNDISQEIWQEAHDMGYSYAAVIQDNAIISLAAVWRYSEAAWELAAVSTNRPENRQQGYAKSVCSFVTKYILDSGRIATVGTGVDNTAMQKTAESIGFQKVSA